MMTTKQGPAMPSSHRGRLYIISGAVAVVLVLLVAWALGGDGDGGDSAATAGGSPSATATDGAPTDGASTDDSSTLGPGETGSPQTGPTELAPTEKPQSTVRTDIGSTADLGSGVTATVTSLEAVNGKAQGVGEVAGPAVRVTLEVTNGSNKAIDTDLALVNLYSGSDRAPASQLSGPGAKPFPSKLGAGDTATGVLVFNVPQSERDRLEIEFTYSTDAARVLFTGSMADG